MLKTHEISSNVDLRANVFLKRSKILERDAIIVAVDDSMEKDDASKKCAYTCILLVLGYMYNYKISYEEIIARASRNK